MQPVRLGVVGPGLIWKNRHEPVLEQLGDAFRISAFCASSERRRAEVEAKYPGTPFVTDYHALVEHPDVDAVVVLTPIQWNAPVALAALEAGKDVLLEKPMARTQEEGRALLETAARTGRRLWVLEQDAYSVRWRALRSLLSSGEIGQVVAYDLTIHALFDADRSDNSGYGKTAWRQIADFPLGALFDGGHHQIATLATLFGAPRWVFASGTQLRPDFGEYDHVLMQFGYANGLRGAFSHASYLGDSRNYFNIRGVAGLISVDAQGATVELNNGDRRIVSLGVAHPADGTSPAGAETLVGRNSHEMMWRAFARAYSEGNEPDYPMACAWRDLATLFGIARSAQQGLRVTLDG